MRHDHDRSCIFAIELGDMCPKGRWDEVKNRMIGGTNFARTLLI
jgi:hypothetical protein